MTSFTVKVAGLKEVEASLKELKKSTARSVIRKALREGGEVLARAARDLVPVDTGGLRESIDVSSRLNRSQKAKHRKRADQEVFVGPDGRPQSITQEFGTYKEPAQPYMRPAWDGNSKAAMTRISDALFVEVERAARRAAAKAIKVK